MPERDRLKIIIGRCIKAASPAAESYTLPSMTPVYKVASVQEAQAASGVGALSWPFPVVSDVQT